MHNSQTLSICRFIYPFLAEQHNFRQRYMEGTYTSQIKWDSDNLMSIPSEKLEMLVTIIFLISNNVSRALFFQIKETQYCSVTGKCFCLLTKSHYLLVTKQYVKYCKYVKDNVGIIINKPCQQNPLVVYV